MRLWISAAKNIMIHTHLPPSDAVVLYINMALGSCFALTGSYCHGCQLSFSSRFVDCWEIEVIKDKVRSSIALLARGVDLAKKLALPGIVRTHKYCHRRGCRDRERRLSGGGASSEV